MFDRKLKTVCIGCAIIERIKPEMYVTCPTCNIEWSKLMDSGLCPTCDNKKFEDEKRKRILEEKMKAVFGSIKAMNHYTFEQFKITDGNEQAYNKLHDFNAKVDNVYIYGECGLGKTHLAYATAKSYALNGRDVVVTTPLKVVDGFRTKSETEKEDKFDEYVEAEVLLIDDLGVSKYTDYALEILCEIMNRRTLQMRNGLIVTSNLSLDQVAKKNHDDRLTSRIAGLCSVIHLEGDDYRLKV